MSQFAQIDGRCLHYSFRPGTGRAVVFANSLGTDLRIWDNVIAALPSDTPVLRLDKRGHGLSALGPVTIPALAEDMAALMDLLDLKDALVCGVSVGGMIAQQLTHMRPDLVSELVLMCTGLKIGDTDSWNPRIETVRNEGILPLAEPILERWFSTGFRASRPVELAGYHAMLTRTDAESYARVCEAIRDSDLREIAPQLNTPALCIAGAEDLATPIPVVLTLCNALPQAQFQVLDNIGHLPCIEAPDIISRTLTERLLP